MRISDWSQTCALPISTTTKNSISTMRRMISNHVSGPAAQVGASPYRYLSSRCFSASLPGSLAMVLRSEEHTSELQSLMRISYAVFCLKKKIIYIKRFKHKHHVIPYNIQLT